MTPCAPDNDGSDEAGLDRPPGGVELLARVDGAAIPEVEPHPERHETEISDNQIRVLLRLVGRMCQQLRTEPCTGSNGKHASGSFGHAVSAVAGMHAAVSGHVCRARVSSGRATHRKEVTMEKNTPNPSTAEDKDMPGWLT